MRSARLRALLVLLLAAVAMLATNLIAAAPAAAEETPVAISEEQDRNALYGALTYAQLTAPTAYEEHINGNVGILETALLVSFNEIIEVNKNNTAELEELFAKIHIAPSREENLELLEDFVTIGRQLGVGKAMAIPARTVRNGGNEHANLSKLDALGFADAYGRVKERLFELADEEAAAGLRHGETTEEFRRRESPRCSRSDISNRPRTPDSATSTSRSSTTRSSPTPAPTSPCRTS